MQVTSMANHLKTFLLFKTFFLFAVLTTFSKCIVATTNSLFPNQTLVPGHVLTSPNQLFKMGFFSPGKSRNMHLGIWYKSTPGVCVWVANRNDPITPPDSQVVFLSISRNRALVIIGVDGSVIWLSNSSVVVPNPVLQLLDTGNLVLVSQDSSERDYVWESFDYPTDTWLPEMKMVDDPEVGLKKYFTSWRSSDDPSLGEYVMKLENRGRAEIVIYRGKMKTFRSGNWNGVCFCGVIPFPNALYDPVLVFKGERLVSIMEYHDNSVIRTTRLTELGVMKRYTMNAKKDDWKPIFSFPVDFCDQYGQCGPNSICRVDMAVKCECLIGFTPKLRKDWDQQDWSGGCTRSKQLKCQALDGFHEFGQLKYPDMLRYWLNYSMSLNECRDMCLRNCSCTAYAPTHITNGGYGCLMWFGDLIDIKEFPPTDSRQKIYIRSSADELSKFISADELNAGSSLILQNEKDKKIPTNLILISVVSGVLVSLLINGILHIVAKHNGRAKNRDENELQVPLFKLATIEAATDNFSSRNIIGQGGFGPVYKGNLLNEGEVAIKRLSSTSSRGYEEFKNEVILIVKLQHRNLVRLLGCCIDRDERILIYEYLHNKSLDYFLFDGSKKRLLTWAKRFDIIMGIVRGLLYLHHDSRLKVIHSDLKAGNILLDRDLNPKIADFGTARCFGEDQCVDRTKRVVGTFGYMAPEYATSGNFSVKSYVFSMGVVLLEIMSGIRNRGLDFRDDIHTFLGHVWLLWKENNIMEAMDECLNDTFVEYEVKRYIQVGLLFVQNYADDRPNMSSVIMMLGTDGGVLAEPKEPGFFNIERRCSNPRTPSNSGLTITDLEAR